MCAKKHVITEALFEVLNSTLNVSQWYNLKNIFSFTGKLYVQENEYTEMDGFWIGWKKVGKTKASILLIMTKATPDSLQTHIFGSY